MFKLKLLRNWNAKFVLSQNEKRVTHATLVLGELICYDKLNCNCLMSVTMLCMWLCKCSQNLLYKVTDWTFTSCDSFILFFNWAYPIPLRLRSFNNLPCVFTVLHFSVFRSSTYGNLGTEAVVLNLAGIFIVIFGILVVYMTTNVYYKRYPRPEDNQLLERSNQWAPPNTELSWKIFESWQIEEISGPLFKIIISKINFFHLSTPFALKIMKKIGGLSQMRNIFQYAPIFFEK